MHVCTMYFRERMGEGCTSAVRMEPFLAMAGLPTGAALASFFLFSMLRCWRRKSTPTMGVLAKKKGSPLHYKGQSRGLSGSVLIAPPACLVDFAVRCLLPLSISVLLPLSPQTALPRLRLPSLLALPLSALRIRLVKGKPRLAAEKMRLAREKRQVVNLALELSQASRLLLPSGNPP